MEVERTESAPPAAQTDQSDDAARFMDRMRSVPLGEFGLAMRDELDRERLASLRLRSAMVVNGRAAHGLH